MLSVCQRSPENHKLEVHVIRAVQNSESSKVRSLDRPPIAQVAPSDVPDRALTAHGLFA